jgi:hypothetical protein
MSRAFLSVAVVVVGLSLGNPYVAEGIAFSGLQWSVTNGNNLTPGPSNWSAANIFPDSSGNLVLQITKVNGVCYGAQMYSNNSFRYGKFEWWIIGYPQQLPPDVIFGLFTYSGPNHFNEIDIEYSRWGNSFLNPGNLAVYPSDVYSLLRCPQNWSLSTNGACGQSFSLSRMTSSSTTQRFTWRSSNVLFETLNGHRSDSDPNSSIWTSRYTPTSSSAIPQKSGRVYMNLYVPNSACARITTSPIRVLIRRFSYSS